MAVAPAVATPMPNPTIPCSDNGVLNTLSLPKKINLYNHTIISLEIIIHEIH
jgi:hypothetical protein